MRFSARTIFPVLGAAGFALLFVMERRRPLRRRVSSPRVRLEKNAGLGAITGALLGAAVMPGILYTARLAERRRLGLLQLAPMPEPVRIALAVVLLDYGYYWWHIMLHRVPMLWRFHLVHHTDLDLDVATALRFHAGEWILSLPFRMLQTIAVGAPVGGVFAFECAMMLGVMFHHSNMRLPLAVETWLRRMLVTPRMHGIHHSTVEREAESNFGTLFTAWDRIHRSLLLDVPQERVTIGVPAYRSESELDLGMLMALPFTAQRDTWSLPPDAA
jgi:sterol desaturase/sphingolipid hydroxylase (fatty acid hydroxylase superfamily)